MGKAELKNNLIKIYFAYVFILLLASAAFYYVLTLNNKEGSTDLLYSNREVNQTLITELNTWFPNEKFKIRTVDRIDDENIEYKFQNKDKENIWVMYKTYKRNGEGTEYEYYSTSSILSHFYLKNKENIEAIATEYGIHVTFDSVKDEFGEFGHTKIVVKEPYEKVEQTHKFAMAVLKIPEIADLYDKYSNSNINGIPQSIISDFSEITIEADEEHPSFTYSIFNDYNYRLNVK